MGKCLNGGSCFNGKCLCAEGFEGEFCEDKEGEHSFTWIWILLAIVLVGVIGYLIYRYKDNIKVWIDRGRSWLCQTERNDSQNFVGDPNDNMPGELGDNSKQS